MNTNVFCEQCSDKIERRSDLLTCFRFLSIVAYHTKCYGQEQKGWNAGGTPINSLAMNFGGIVMFAFCTCVFIWTRTWIFIPLALLMPFVRLLSWWMYERHLRE
jgi:hypothetical protein